MHNISDRLEDSLYAILHVAYSWEHNTAFLNVLLRQSSGEKPFYPTSIVIIANGQKEALRMSSNLTLLMVSMYTWICPNLLNVHLKYIEFFCIYVSPQQTCEI